MSSNSFLSRVHDTLISSGVKLVSYAPQSVKTRAETVYAKAGNLRVTVQDYSSTKANVLAQQLSHVAASSQARYAAIIRRASAAIESTAAMAISKLEEVKAIAMTAMLRTWDRIPDGIKTRTSVIAHAAGVRATAVRVRADATWKYVSEDPKARMSTKAAVGGAVSGGATGFFAGGAVGAVVGIIPAFFTFGLSIPLGAAVGSGIGLGCGAAAGGAAGLASGVGYANKAEMTRSVSRCKDYVKDQAAHIQDRASVSASAVTRKLGRSTA